VTRQLPAIISPAIPDLGALIDAVYAAQGTGDGIHGPDHWKRVALAGAELLQETPKADPTVVYLFALLHDTMRLSDGRDPEHGWRAAWLAEKLRERGLFVLSDERMVVLTYALEHHDKGATSPDPTVGVAWDADRLCLRRVGISPSPRLLSTPPARESERIHWARHLQRGDLPGWHALAERYGLLGSET